MELYELLRDLIEKCEVGLLIDASGWHLSGKGVVGVVAVVFIFRLPTIRASPASSCRRPLSACAVKRRRFPVGASPTRRFAPAGSNRSSHGGNEMAEAFE